MSQKGGSILPITPATGPRLRTNNSYGCQFGCAGRWYSNQHSRRQHYRRHHKDQISNLIRIRKNGKREKEGIKVGTRLYPDEGFVGDDFDKGPSSAIAPAQDVNDFVYFLAQVNQHERYTKPQEGRPGEPNSSLDGSATDDSTTDSHLPHIPLPSSPQEIKAAYKESKHDANRVYSTPPSIPLSLPPSLPGTHPFQANGPLIGLGKNYKSLQHDIQSQRFSTPSSNLGMTFMRPPHPIGLIPSGPMRVLMNTHLPATSPPFGAIRHSRKHAHATLTQSSSLPGTPHRNQSADSTVTILGSHSSSSNVFPTYVPREMALSGVIAQCVLSNPNMAAHDIEMYVRHAHPALYESQSIGRLIYLHMIISQNLKRGAQFISASNHTIFNNSPSNSSPSNHSTPLSTINALHSSMLISKGTLYQSHDAIKATKNNTEKEDIKNKNENKIEYTVDNDNNTTMRSTQEEVDKDKAIVLDGRVGVGVGEDKRVEMDDTIRTLRREDIDTGDADKVVVIEKVNGHDSSG